MIETYKFRLYPTEDQKMLLNKHFGSVRFIYNWALDYDIKKYAQTQKHLGWISILNSGDYKKLKEDNVWLKEINSQSLQKIQYHILTKHFRDFLDIKADFQNLSLDMTIISRLKFRQTLKQILKQRKFRFRSF